MTEENTILKVDYHNYSHIILNDPKRLNVFFHYQSHHIHNKLQTCESNAETKFIILSGVGKAFCAGGDIKRISQSLMSGTKEGTADFYTMIYEFYQMIYFMATMKTPIICYMNGIIAGGGTAYPQVAAFKIATENTVFFIPECRVGHFTDASNSFNLSKLEGQLGVYLALTGDQIKAQDVLFAGLASHFVLSSNLKLLEDKISELDDINLDTINSAIQEFEVKMDHNKSAQFTLHGDKLEIIDRCFKYDTVEEIIAALEKETSEFAGKCLKSMGYNSPTSMKITLAAIRYAEDKTMSESLAFEYRAWRGSPFRFDYNEGIKATLYEKRRPQWNPARVEDVVEDIQSSYFPPVSVAPIFRSDIDFKTRKYEMYLLPTTQEVCRVKSKYNFKSNSDITNWFVNNRRQKFGVREKVEDILKRQGLEEDIQKAAVNNQKSFSAKL